MPDGTRLAARAFFPAGANERPTGTVVEYLPYRKSDLYRFRDDIAGPRFAKDGMVYLRVDVRGTGCSEGWIADEYSEIEQQDGWHLFDWIVQQPWSNGHIGMRGISYGSFNALMAAANAHPALKAIVSCCGSDQRYADDVHFRGGCLLEDQWGWGNEWQLIMRSPPDPAIVGKDRWRAIWEQRLEAVSPLSIVWNEHSAHDDYWKIGSIQDYTKIKAAILNIGGLLDCYIPSVSRMMERAPQVPQKALIGPWTHKWPGYPERPGHDGAPESAANGYPGPGIDWLPIEGKWWRHWLNGETNDIMSGPQLWAFRQDMPGAYCYPRDTLGSWISEPEWPSPRLRARTFHLNPAALEEKSGVRKRLAHRTNLIAGFASRTLATSGPREWFREQSRDDALALTFDSPPLAAPIDVLGEPLFKIRVRADRPVAKLCVRLCEVTPNGHSHFVSLAILNLTQRGSSEHPEPLEPGKDYDVELKGVFASYRFKPGNRIRVAISENCWPAVWPSPELVTLEITTGVSSVVLPERDVMPGEQLPYPQFVGRYDRGGVDPSPYFQPLQGVTITGPEGRRTFNLEGGSVAEVNEQFNESGDIYLGDAARIRRTIREDDPSSAEIEVEGIKTYRRGAWRAKLRSWSLGRCTPTHLICEEIFEAWDGDEKIVSRHWRQEIPRVLV